MSDQTALTIPDPDGMNQLVTELSDTTTGWLEQLHGLVGDNATAQEMVNIVHENVQALADHALHLTALTVGLMEIYETTRTQLKQALHDKAVAEDEADEAYANAKDDLREDRQFRQEIECEVARDLIIEADTETWREGYDCGHTHANKDREAEITYLYAELDRYKYLLELAGVEVKDSV
jgi:hypothetical protein